MTHIDDTTLDQEISAATCSPWLPLQLRTPSASAARGDIKFAFFAEKRRLLIENSGQWVLYDCGDHQIRAIRARLDPSEELTFTSQRGELPIAELRPLS
jgi:hypothetical protein